MEVHGTTSSACHRLFSSIVGYWTVETNPKNVLTWTLTGPRLGSQADCPFSVPGGHEIQCSLVIASRDFKACEMQHIEIAVDLFARASDFIKIPL